MRNRETRPLLKLHEELGYSHLLEYTKNRDYKEVTKGRTTTSKALEVLSLTSKVNWENISIAYFKTSPTIIAYAGQNPETMKQTLDALRLPTARSENLGEKVFQEFYAAVQHLEGQAVYLSSKIRPGKEHQFKQVMQKLIDYYSTQTAAIIPTQDEALLN